MKKLINREVSWLHFNERVLQEAMDEGNPIIERLRFLGIFSNNRDEFFRVRVASIKRMIPFELEHKSKKNEKTVLIVIINCCIFDFCQSWVVPFCSGVVLGDWVIHIYGFPFAIWSV